MRFALRDAREAYTAEPDAQTAWTHFASNYAALQSRAGAKGLQALVASYGPALIDRALLDALCLHSGVSFATAMSANLPGIDIAGSGLADDLAGFDMPGFLAGRQPRTRIDARHTVGLVDAIDDSDALPDAPHDGLPATLAAVVRRYGHTHFKLKLCGDAAQDIARLERIASVLDGLARLASRSTATSSTPTPDAVGAFLDAHRCRRPRCTRWCEHGLHRAADLPRRALQRRRVARLAARPAADRRIRRHARRLPAGPRARLHRRVEQELQGPLQVDCQRRALRALELPPATPRATSCPAKT